MESQAEEMMAVDFTRTVRQRPNGEYIVTLTDEQCEFCHEYAMARWERWQKKRSGAPKPQLGRRPADGSEELLGLCGECGVLLLLWVQDWSIIAQGHPDSGWDCIIYVTEDGERKAKSVDAKAVSYDDGHLAFFKPEHCRADITVLAYVDRDRPDEVVVKRWITREDFLRLARHAALPNGTELRWLVGQDVMRPMDELLNRLA